MKILAGLKMDHKGPNWHDCVFVSYDSTFRIGSLVFYVLQEFEDINVSKLREPIFLKKFLLVQKQAKKAQNGIIYLFAHYGSFFSQD